MTLPGGPADKLGNRYEKWWTISEFVRMLHGETEAIRIEDPNVQKTEFVVKTGSRRELHQAKRSHPNGKWSLSALGAAFLNKVGDLLANKDYRFVFVSGSDAPELTELCEAARAAESTAEFKRAFLVSARRKNGLIKVCDWWKCDVHAAIEYLRRIDVRTIDDRELRQKVAWGVEALFLATPTSVIDAMRGIIEDSVHRTIARYELVEELTRLGYTPRRLSSPEHASVAVRTATDHYLDSARRKLIRQKIVPREATEKLLLRVDGNATDSVLTGIAGVGKTTCVTEVVEGLREQGSPVLAFRLDRCLSAPNTTDLGQYLGLEDSPVMALAAAAEATASPGVLIVDQLDSVSTISGRSSGAFDLVERLLHEARGMRPRATIHTIVVCRAFDWQNDSRMRRLMPDPEAQVDVTEFTIDETKTILLDASYDPELFRKRQLKLLQLPQNLSLFVDAGFDPVTAPTFGTATELFDRYWKKKRWTIETRAGSSKDHWREVIAILCDEMTSTQDLSVPEEKLDRIPTGYLNLLASEGVVTYDGRRYGFGHESFFDYCFARLFITWSKSLVSFLKESEQHLFRRAQVRQVLVYLRDRDFARYIEELCNLLSDDGIRAHIKDLAFALLAEAVNPTNDEWKIWETWTAPVLSALETGTPNTDKLSALAWQRFFGSPSWFKFADQIGVVKDWLASGSNRFVNEIVKYLKVHHRDSPDRVAALLMPYADRRGKWVPRLQVFVEWAHQHKSRRLFDLHLRLVDNGTLDADPGSDELNRTFREIHHGLNKDRPEWVPELLAQWLRRRLAVILTSGEKPHNFFGYDRSAAATFLKSAERAPAEFVKHVLPVVLEISDSFLIEDTPPRRDAVWRLLIKTKLPSSRDACLMGTTTALSRMARDGNADLGHVIGNLRARNTHVANHLLLALYRRGASRYSHEAITMLCNEPWRFQCGYSDNPNWCAMELTREVILHCTAEDRESLENVILSYLSPFEQTSAGYRLAGQARFALLSAIPIELLSARAIKHFRELERKFRTPRGGPREMCGGFVRSPIKKAQADKMTDAHWLRAITRYKARDREYCWEDPLKGGATELARVLEARVKEEPDRFAHLSLKFPPDTNSVYLERTLAALQNAEIPVSLKLQVCCKAFADSRDHCGASIADVLGSIEEQLPEDAVRMLQWLATDHEDPDCEAWQEDAGDGRTFYGGDIYNNGITTTRGRAAEAIRDLIFVDATYIDRFRNTLEQMIQDPSTSVLSCVAGTLLAVFHHDPAFGLSLFLRANLTEDRLLSTPHAYELIRCALRDSFGELQPVLERMLRSGEPEVRESGARLAGIAALGHPDASGLVEEALRGSSRHRLGIAQIASANIAVPDTRAWSEARLTILFNDKDPEVRQEAASCFSDIRDDGLDAYEDLITAFCESSAYQESSFWFLRTLDDSLGRLPGVTCLACERFLDRFTDDARNIGTKWPEATDTIVKLIFRTYQQHQNDEWTSRSLDMIDCLCMEGIVDTRREFEEFDR